MKEGKDLLKGELKEDIGTKTSFTDAEIENIKAEHGKVVKVELKDEDDNIVHTFIFKTKYPRKREIMMQAAVFIQNKQMQKYVDVMIYNSIINGADLVREDDDIYLALVPLADKLFTQYRAFLGKF